MMYALMEGVEDIPEIVMTEGINWEWESFPEYLDAIERRRLDIDVAAQLPHSPLRVYAMGKRGADREPATEDDLKLMRRLTAEAMEAGALGFGTSRMPIHRTRDGDLIPSFDAGRDEMLAIMSGMRDAGKGVVQAIIDFNKLDADFETLTELAEVSGRPLSYTLSQHWGHETTWKRALDMTRQANARGLSMTAQFMSRPTGVLYGLDLSFHPFCRHPSYQPIAKLPLAERVAAMRTPELRAALLAERPVQDRKLPMIKLFDRYDVIFELGDPPVYDPHPSQSIAEIAKREGRSAAEIAYDLLLKDEGRTVLYQPTSNFVECNLDAVGEMLADANTVVALGDGGAHYGMIADYGYTTYTLAYWARDRAGARLSVGEAVRKLTSDPARVVGLNDRGRIAPGYKADLNLIDFETLGLRQPQPKYDLPGGGRRLMQDASGYVATIGSGVVNNKNGQPTGARPGRLVRGAQASPAAQEILETA